MKMVSRKSAAGKSQPAASSTAMDAVTPLLKFGAALFQEYTATAPSPSVAEVQLSRYGDYVRHFGFSIERESQTRTEAAAAIQSGAGHSRDTQHEAATDKAPKNQAKRTSGADQQDITCEDAGWGCAEAGRNAADAHCHAVGSLAGLTDVVEVTARVVAPFQQVTWRQTRSQCAMMKARCLYMWICTHFTVILERDAIAEARMRMEAGADGAGGAAANGSKGGGKASAAAAKGDRKRDGSKKDVRTAQQQQHQQLAGEQAAVEVPADPIVDALGTRRVTPRQVALLYSRMLDCAGLGPGSVVAGYLKGIATEESFEWYWNVVCVEGKSYLVDIAASVYAGPLRAPVIPADAADVTPALASTAGAAATSASAAAAAGGKSKKETVSVAAVPPPQDELPAGVEVMCVDKPPRLSVRRRAVEEFYFMCNPMHFYFTHYPQEPRHALLTRLPSRMSWEVAPRLAHDSFRFSVSLVSQRRKSSFSARSTPFYITLKNESPADTELCCAVYPGTLIDLPEDFSGVSPLDPHWTWHQREESTQLETFTVMVPQCGFYSVVIGARKIRTDPYSPDISQDPYVPIVFYQVMVNFVPNANAHLPRQHLSPSICRLMSPLSAQVPVGVRRFVVMPSCSNVAAVAVVSATAQQRDGEGEGGAGSPPPTSSSFPAYGRELLCFLSFDSETATYAGEAALHAGENAEVWVLYAAPDKNGLRFREKLALQAKKRRPPTPPIIPLPTKGSASGRRRNGEPSGPTEEERERSTLLEKLRDACMFVPFVTGMEVKKFCFKDSSSYIQPQPSVLEERYATMRRLIGVTGALYAEASALNQREFCGVGAYFDVDSEVLNDRR